jgi:hypothetical protein
MLFQPLFRERDRDDEVVFAGHDAGRVSLSSRVFQWQDTARRETANGSFARSTRGASVRPSHRNERAPIEGQVGLLDRRCIGRVFRGHDGGEVRRVLAYADKQS